MKTKLLLSFLSITVLFGYSQTDIEQFPSASESMYAEVTPVTTIDQSPEGASVMWTFDLNKTGDTSDTHGTPTAMESSTYPGTTSVTVTTNESTDNKVFYKDDSGEISFTGLVLGGLELNYSGDNGLIGTFPLSYDGTNGVDVTDDVSGTFSYNGGVVSGTFSGEIMVDVDAYGTLVVNDVGGGAFNGPVTRLKLVQDLDLTTGGSIPISGTATQTTYYYYDASNADLVFRSTELNIASPVLNDSGTVMESLLSSSLGIDDPGFSDAAVRVFPNPVKNELNFDLNNGLVINKITVSDSAGRNVLHAQAKKNSVSVKQLASGIYIATISTDKGNFSRKFVKQ